MIDHTILMSKLNQYGIQSKYFDWFKNYLNNRKQHISYVDYVPILSKPYIHMFHTMLYTQKFYMQSPTKDYIGPFFFLIFVSNLHAICNKYA